MCVCLCAATLCEPISFNSSSSKRSYCNAITKVNRVIYQTALGKMRQLTYLKVRGSSFTTQAFIESANLTTPSAIVGLQLPLYAGETADAGYIIPISIWKAIPPPSRSGSQVPAKHGGAQSRPPPQSFFCFFRHAHQHTQPLSRFFKFPTRPAHSRNHSSRCLFFSPRSSRTGSPKAAIFPSTSSAALGCSCGSDVDGRRCCLNDAGTGKVNRTVGRSSRWLPSLPLFVCGLGCEFRCVPRDGPSFKKSVASFGANCCALFARESGVVVVVPASPREISCSLKEGGKKNLRAPKVRCLSKTFLSEFFF